MLELHFFKSPFNPALISRLGTKLGPLLIRAMAFRGYPLLWISTSLVLRASTFVIKFKRMSGAWGPMMGEIRFWAKDGPSISGDKRVQLYANKDKAFSSSISAGGANRFAAKGLPSWLSLTTLLVKSAAQHLKSSLVISSLMCTKV